MAVTITAGAAATVAAGRCWTWSCAFQHVLTASTVTYDESESSFLSTGLRYNILLTCMYTTADSCSLTSTIFTIVRSTMLCVYTVVDMHLEYLRLLTLYRTCSCRPGGIPQRPKSTDLPTISPVPAHTNSRSNGSKASNKGKIISTKIPVLCPKVQWRGGDPVVTFERRCSGRSFTRTRSSSSTRSKWR
jgi:hypothetical protein